MNFIKNINNYLLQRYPTLWNTRIVWMLLINLFLHILFFIIGYFSHSNPKSMQYSGVIDDFFTNGLILANCIISVLLLVSWLVFMFKNNSFKNFYPTSNFKLFLQFVCYLVVIFSSITFYYSYMFGFKTYINKAYPNQEFVKNVEIINKAYPFLSLEYQDYELDKKAYPKIFMDLFCETNDDLIHFNQKYYTLNNKHYQFFSIYKVAVTQRDKYGDFKYPATEYKNGTELAYKNIETDTCFYFFKKNVVDVSNYINNASFSYYNFSKVFYTVDLNTVDYFDRYNTTYYNNETGMAGANPNIDKNFAFNKNLHEVLNRKNPAEIKQILNDFLQLSKKYQIETNLNTNNWFKMVYNPDSFEVKHFIASEDSFNEMHEYTEPIDAAVATSDTLTGDATVTANYENTIHKNYVQKLSKNYYKINNLKYFLRNIELVKTVDFTSRSIHVYIWITYFLATLIFSFRVTNLRAVLFAGISAKVLSLVIALIALLYSVGLANSPEYFISYLVLAVSSVILAIPILFLNKTNKFISAICVNLSINGFVLYGLLIFAIISIHQRSACFDINNNYIGNCTTVFEALDMNISYILLAAGIIFMYFYVAVIKKWRALPE